MVTPLVALIILKRESLKVPWHWLHSKKKKKEEEKGGMGKGGKDAGGGEANCSLTVIVTPR